jgi:hypothetical protein
MAAVAKYTAPKFIDFKAIREKVEQKSKMIEDKKSGKRDDIEENQENPLDNSIVLPKTQLNSESQHKTRKPLKLKSSTLEMVPDVDNSMLEESMLDTNQMPDSSQQKISIPNPQSIKNVQSSQKGESKVTGGKGQGFK